MMLLPSAKIAKVLGSFQNYLLYETLRREVREAILTMMKSERQVASVLLRSRAGAPMTGQREVVIPYLMAEIRAAGWKVEWMTPLGAPPRLDIEMPKDEDDEDKQ